MSLVFISIFLILCYGGYYLFNEWSTRNKKKVPEIVSINITLMLLNVLLLSLVISGVLYLNTPETILLIGLGYLSLGTGFYFSTISIERSLGYEEKRGLNKHILDKYPELKHTFFIFQSPLSHVLIFGSIQLILMLLGLLLYRYGLELTYIETGFLGLIISGLLAYGMIKNNTWKAQLIIQLPILFLAILIYWDEAFQNSLYFFSITEIFSYVIFLIIFSIIKSQQLDLDPR